MDRFYIFKNCKFISVDIEIDESVNSTAINSKPAICANEGDTPARLCKSSFNTTAPMYGVSLTSGKPVTIVQIFPDLLQQVVYETCE